jgi:hypothetical protein
MTGYPASFEIHKINRRQNFICVCKGSPVSACIPRLVDSATGTARINVSYTPSGLRIDESDTQKIKGSYTRTYNPATNIRWRAGTPSARGKYEQKDDDGVHLYS